ncbi:DUF4238 domain-containing protein [Tritonibacter scottomollicae]|uniref:DUF4238 domain-containing protein n=1 Tax=Tritonibacter scottomollicae TaxID=483013 RepID=A0ABZ0HK41_TRISK|nr:DUF4238 domain-containing protein [Tritonibacter scottomollicae]WOI34638.1 DUF4238 domain-containing protein [Tritonibacter scottomollicae]
MSVPDRHHILAETYQKQFIAEGKCVWVHDKEEGKQFPTQPKNSTVRTGFNTALLPDGSFDKASMETFFSTLETEYAQIITQFRSGFQTSERIGYAIAFMQFQAARSPLVRRFMTDLLLQLTPDDERLLKVLQVENVGIELLRRARAGDADAKTKIGLHSTKHIVDGVSNALKGLWYRPIRLCSPMPLVTSDNPVIYFSVKRQNGKVQTGLPFEGSRVLCFFPMAKDILLFGDTERPPLDKLMNDRPSQISNSIALVKRLNAVSAINAERSIVAPSETSLKRTMSSIAKKTASVSTLLEMYNQLAKAALYVTSEHWK